MVSYRLKKYRASLEMVEMVETKLIDPAKFSIRSSYENIGSLIASIMSKGLLQPVIIRPNAAAFDLVAGHRRFEACRKLKWSKIPCIVKELSDREAFELSLVENVQRETLDPVEEAKAFTKYVLDYGWGGKAELAGRIGKSEEYVSHRISLLNLPDSVIAKVNRRQLNASTAYELSRLNDSVLQEEVADLAVENKATIRTLRSATKLIRSGFSPAESMLAAGFLEPGKQSVDSRIGQTDTGQVIIALKMCMIRIDAISGQSAESKSREIVHVARLGVHNLIDKMLKLRKDFDREMTEKAVRSERSH